MAYPNRIHPIENLIQDHLKQVDEQLVLAVYYPDYDRPYADCLLEVFSNFGLNDVSWDNMMFEVEYASSQAFPLNINERLRLLLTNPVELLYAVKNQWPQLAPLRAAIEKGQGHYKILHSEGKSEYVGAVRAALFEVTPAAV